MEVEEDVQGAHPQLVVGLYEPVKGKGVPKSFPFDNDLEEFRELSSWKG